MQQLYIYHLFFMRFFFSRFRCLCLFIIFFRFRRTLLALAPTTRAARRGGRRKPEMRPAAVGASPLSGAPLDEGTSAARDTNDRAPAMAHNKRGERAGAVRMSRCIFPNWPLPINNFCGKKN